MYVYLVAKKLLNHEVSVPTCIAAFRFAASMLCAPDTEAL